MGEHGDKTAQSEKYLLRLHQKIRGWFEDDVEESDTINKKDASVQQRFAPVQASVGLNRGQISVMIVFFMVNRGPLKIYPAYFLSCGNLSGA
jgi:hypothetical protein